MEALSQKQEALEKSRKHRPKSLYKMHKYVNFGERGFHRDEECYELEIKKQSRPKIRSQSKSHDGNWGHTQ